MGWSGGDFDGQMILRYDGTNATGIFRLIFQRTTFYNVTDKNMQVCYPMPLGDSWKGAVMDIAKNVFCLPAMFKISRHGRRTTYHARKKIDNNRLNKIIKNLRGCTLRSHND
jgi:hypothetical protein